MKDTIILEGKTYISARRAAKIINYAQDYIGQLCRAGKLDCKMVGRSWFVTEESLLAHRENAIDGFLDRTPRLVKSAQEVIAEVNESKEIVSPVAPVVSPLQPSSLKYETEKTALLPELAKKVPTTFALPKNISETVKIPFNTPRISTPRPMIAAGGAATISNSSANPLVTLLVVALIGVTGLFFILSVSLVNRTASVGYDVASVRIAASDFFAIILSNLGLRPQESPLAKMNSSAPSRNNSQAVGTGTTTMTEWNGIGVIPTTGITAEDEAAKRRVADSFSDEVTVKPDESGTAGVITPVFRKNTGDDFMYVLVPVKEEKK